MQNNKQAMYQQTNTLNRDTIITYSTASQKPEAWITKKQGRLKVYGPNVFLKDGAYFEIELFNPTSSRVLAKIKVNGISISSGGIIVDPGQRVYLERFIDENCKFKFSVYEVEDIESATYAIKNNGNIKVDFYSELTYHQPNFQGLAYHHLATSTYPHTVPSINCSTSTGAPVFETGKVEKGLKSNQTLKSGYGTFNAWPCSVYHYKILPESQKAVKYGEIRSYCTDCSTRIKKSTWKFCPNCGTSTNN